MTEASQRHDNPEALSLSLSPRLSRWRAEAAAMNRLLLLLALTAEIGDNWRKIIETPAGEAEPGEAVSGKRGSN